MKSQYTKKSCLENEKGQAALFSPFLIIGLIILGGLAVDTANVFIQKSRVQRSLDAASMAAITKYANGESDAQIIEDSAIQMATYNFNRMGIEGEEIVSLTANFTIDENSVATLEMDADVDTPTFFMTLVPGADLDTVAISGESSSRRIPAMISLVLDTSGSMDCNGSCPEKLQGLKDAANAFVNSFEDGLDEMAIIQFSNQAEVLHPMTPLNKALMHTIINNLTAQGWTNIADGVQLGRKEIESASNPVAVKAILLFSDGSPNAVKPFFISPKNPLWKNFPEEDPEYYNFIVEGETRIVRNPENMNQVCSRTYYCMWNFKYRDSRYNYNPHSSSINMYSKTHLKQEAYHLAILETDYAKTDGTTIYTIGLGEPANEGSDVYQDAHAGALIKSYLLKRIANDPAGAEDPPFVKYPNSASHPAGLFFQTPDEDDLVSLFEAVALRLKLRLIE